MASKSFVGFRARLLRWGWVIGFILFVPAAGAAPMLGPGITAQTVAPLLRADHQMSPAVERFYQGRDFRPAWIANPAADEAVAALRGSAADGLAPQRFHVSWLEAQQRLGTAADAARYDRTLTAGLIRYAEELRRGIVDPRKADEMVGISRPPFHPALTLAAALDHGTFKQWLASLPPAHRQYAELKAALARYCAIAAKGGWPKVPVVRKIALEPGNPDLLALRHRLAAGDAKLAAAPMGDLAALEAAVKRFQTRNGLVVDGVVGRKTIHALNISAAERVAQIEANMERWRWLLHRFPPRYVEVNAADATLKAVDKGKIVLTSRVITGKPKTPTAIFNATAEALTVNPPWIVPSSIARKEIMPKVRRNPAYLSRHHMVIAGGQIRQLPGADNALGYLKVEMPNSFTAYLHDTSARRLFARDQRHLSHGCMRVQKIRPLGSWLLTGDVHKGLDRINAAIATGATQKIALDRPVPVFVLYWTAIPRADGGVDFRPDIYGRDKRLIAALAGQLGTDAAFLGVKSETECAASKAGGN